MYNTRTRKPIRLVSRDDCRWFLPMFVMAILVVVSWSLMPAIYVAIVVDGMIASIVLGAVAGCLIPLGIARIMIDDVFPRMDTSIQEELSNKQMFGILTVMIFMWPIAVIVRGIVAPYRLWHNLRPSQQR